MDVVGVSLDFISVCHAGVHDVAFGVRSYFLSCEQRIYPVLYDGCSISSLHIGGFEEPVELKDGERYVLVLPAGSVRTRFREDIVNRELRLNINGSFSDTAVTSAHGSSVSVGCSGGVVYIEGVRPGTPVEVFASGGSLVQRCAAVQGVTRLPLPGHGCYVVRVGGKAYKVVA